MHKQGPLFQPHLYWMIYNWKVSINSTHYFRLWLTAHMDYHLKILIWALLQSYNSCLLIKLIFLCEVGFSYYVALIQIQSPMGIFFPIRFPEKRKNDTPPRHIIPILGRHVVCWCSLSTPLSMSLQSFFIVQFIAELLEVFLKDVILPAHDVFLLLNNSQQPWIFPLTWTKTTWISEWFIISTSKGKALN